MEKEARTSEVEKIILKHYSPVDPSVAGVVEGSQILGEQWYAPKDGPDTLKNMLEDLKKFLKK